MTENPSAETWLDIEDEVYTPAVLQKLIDERWRTRPTPSPTEARSYDIPSFGEAYGIPDLPADMPQLFNLIQHLQAAESLYPKVEVDLVFAPSPASRLPLIGPMWSRLRRFAHELVIFYVNRFVGHQTNINYHLVNSLVELTHLTIAQGRLLNELLPAKPPEGTTAKEVD